VTGGSSVHNHGPLNKYYLEGRDITGLDVNSAPETRFFHVMRYINPQFTLLYILSKLQTD